LQAAASIGAIDFLQRLNSCSASRLRARVFGCRAKSLGASDPAEAGLLLITIALFLKPRARFVPIRTGGF
jgi:hypothetical protein